MEAISRNNYESWFMDYLDGQLDDEQLCQLLDFLESNPDLKSELQGISIAVLPPSPDLFASKEALLKTEIDIPGIASVDQLCIARMENDLSTDEAAAFDLRLQHEPALAEAFSGFQATFLKSEVIVFPHKSELKHKTRALAPWIITVVSAAALVLFAWILWPRGEENSTDMAATGGKPAGIEQQQIVIPVVPQPAQTPERIAAFRVKRATGEIKTTETEILPERIFSPMNSMALIQPGILTSIPDPVRTPVVFASVFNNTIQTAIPVEEYMTLPQYALQLFREKVLGQDPKLVRKTRFSFWEVAGAGVNKLNDIAGTKMKLDREYDSSGQILAVSFNSRLFDVETPVHPAGNR